jgi:ribulose-phosphate 3-epimerase
LDIEVDGGITLENADILKEAGANILVVGSFLVFSEDKKEVVNKIKNII